MTYLRKDNVDDEYNRQFFVLIEMSMRESLCGKRQWQTRRIVRE